MNAMTDTKAATHKNVHVALAAAQAEMEAVRKGSVNPAFKSRYADLSDVMQAVLPALNRHGLALFHTMDLSREQPAMVTFLAHGESGTQIECPVPLIVNKNDMQGMKSAITYAKRIGAESVTGTAPEDDDGNAAAAAPPRREEPARRQEQPADVQDQLAAFAAECTAAIREIAGMQTLADLSGYWKALDAANRAVAADARVIAAKDKRKDELKPAPAEMVDDEIPY